MVKIQDVAEAAGVSVASVSRVLTGRRPVEPATHAAVMAAARTLGYTTNTLARALRSRSSMTLGMVVPGIANPFFIGLVQAVERWAAAEGYDLFLCDSRERPDIEADRLRALAGRQVDGIALIACDDGDGARVDGLGIPVVAVDRDPGDPSIDRVGVDNAAGIRAVLKHLAATGRRRLAYAGAAATSSAARERLEAYRNGLDPESAARMVLGDFSIDWGIAAAARIAALDPLPDAVVCGNDLIAFGLCRGLRERGVAVPGRVAVTGFDDIEFCRFVEPAITTVRQPVEEIGREAVRRLLARIRGPATAPGAERIAPRLIVRDSSAPSPGR